MTPTPVMYRPQLLREARRRGYTHVSTGVGPLPLKEWNPYQMGDAYRGRLLPDGTVEDASGSPRGRWHLMAPAAGRKAPAELAGLAFTDAEHLERAKDAMETARMELERVGNAKNCEGAQALLWNAQNNMGAARAHLLSLKSHGSQATDKETRRFQKLVEYGGDLYETVGYQCTKGKNR